MLDSPTVSRHLATFAILFGLLAAIVALTPYDRALQRQDAAGRTVTTSLSCDAPLTQVFGAGQDATEVECGAPASRRILVAGTFLVVSVAMGVSAYRRQGPLVDIVTA